MDYLGPITGGSSGGVAIAELFLGRLQSVFHQHCHRHGTNATGYRSDMAGNLANY